MVSAGCRPKDRVGRKYHLSYQNLAALVFFRFKEPERAKQVSEQGIAAYPYNGELWLLLALSEYALGDTEAAMRAAQRSRELGPNERNALVYNHLTQGTPIPLDYPD